MNVADLLEESVRRSPDHPAVLRAEGAVSYAQLWDQILEAERVLREHGVSPGMCIGLHYQSGYEYIVLTYALWRCGACSTPIAVELTAAEKTQVSQEIDLDSILTSKRQYRFFPGADTADELSLFGKSQLLIENQTRTARPPEFAEVNGAFIRFTSGTTGSSKGVVLSHESVYERIEAANGALCIGPEDRVLWLLSMSYHFTVSIVAYLTYGASIVLCKNHFGRTILETAAQHDITVSYGSPSHYDQMSQAQGDETLPSLRIALSTATALSDEIALNFQQRFGLPLNQAYGIIEVGLPCINTDTSKLMLGSVGRPTPAFRIELADAGLGEERQTLRLKGPGMLDAYYSPWTPREQILRDGWFSAGDLGWRDEDGAVFITGRSKEVISIGGMKFFPQEVEQVLGEHEAVDQVCVLRGSDERMGDVAVARVVLAPGAEVSGDELRAFCRQRLVTYKVPAEIEFVEELERTASGKLIRTRQAEAAN